MAVHVLEEETRKLREKGARAVVLESDIRDNFPQAIMELQHAGTRHMAIKAAASKFGDADPRVGMGSQPFPVDADGNPIENPTGREIHSYRIQIEITGGF